MTAKIIERPAVLQWNWLDTEPLDAAREARELGALQGSLRTGSEE